MKHPKKGSASHFHAYFLASYRKLKYRCLSGNKRYRGLPFMGQEDWTQFLINTTEDRMRLYSLWEASNFHRRLSPSVDRVNPREGYLMWNCHWLPQYENSGGRTPNPKKKNCSFCRKPFECFRKNGRGICRLCERKRHKEYARRKSGPTQAGE